MGKGLEDIKTSVEPVLVQYETCTCVKQTLRGPFIEDEEDVFYPAVKIFSYPQL